MKTTRLFIIALLVSTLLLSSCSLVNKQNSSSASLESGTLLFDDDFSDSSNGWGTMGRSGGEIAYEYEGITIKVNTPSYMYWTISNGIFDDTRIEIDAVLLEGPADDNFGVICRFQDNDNFYGFVISHDGYYGIFRMQNGILNMANNGTNLDYSDAIRQGGVVNHISVICDGDMLSLRVNDQLIAEKRDPVFSEGQIGLIAGAYETVGVKVLFDNLGVYVP